jgi:hypothetical protein
MPGVERLFFEITMRLLSDRPRSRLVRNVIALATGAVLLAGTAARADDPLLLATGGVYGSLAQNSAACYVFNAGGSPVAVSMFILDETGGSAGPFTRTVVLPGTIAAVVNFITNSQAYSCRIFGTASANLRGVMDIRDVNDNVLSSSDLR